MLFKPVHGCRVEGAVGRMRDATRQVECAIHGGGSRGVASVEEEMMLGGGYA